jgi:ribosomal protein S1
MEQNNVINQKEQRTAQSGGQQKKQSRNGNWEARREQENAAAIKNYKVGQVVEGKINVFFKAGGDHPHMSALVQLQSGGSALLLYNEIPGYPRSVLSQVYSKGDVIDVEVTAIRPSKSRMSVSLVPVLCRKFAKDLERGHIVEATVIQRVNFGYFVDLGGGLEALLHNENLDQNFQHQNETFEIGEKTEVVILSNENEGKRIGVGRWQLFEYPVISTSQSQAQS